MKNGIETAKRATNTTDVTLRVCITESDDTRQPRLSRVLIIYSQDKVFALSRRFAMANNPRPLSTGEGFLLGGVAACVAVSLGIQCLRLSDHLFRLLFQILQKWQKLGCNYRVNS